MRKAYSGAVVVRVAVRDRRRGGGSRDKSILIGAKVEIMTKLTRRWNAT